MARNKFEAEEQESQGYYRPLLGAQLRIRCIYDKRVERFIINFLEEVKHRIIFILCFYELQIR